MNRSVALFATAVLTAGAAQAGALVHHDLVECTPALCGGYAQNQATMSFSAASVQVDATGLVKIRIKRLVDKATGQVIANHPFYLNFGTVLDQMTHAVFLGNFTTDADGNYSGTLKTDSGAPFKFSSATYSGSFIVNDWSPQFSQFISGFVVP